MLLKLLWGKNVKYFALCADKLNEFGAGKFDFRLTGIWTAEITLDGEPAVIYDRRENRLQFPVLGDHIHLGATEPRDREFHALVVLGGLGTALAKRLNGEFKASFYSMIPPLIPLPCWFLEISFYRWLLFLPEPSLSAHPAGYDVLIRPQDDYENFTVIPYLSLVQHNITPHSFAILDI